MQNIQNLIGKVLQKQIVESSKLNNFKTLLTTLYNNVDSVEKDVRAEERQKGYFQTFLKSVLDNEYEVSLDYNRIDLVLHESSDALSPISVIFEIKSIGNKAERISDTNLNVKALHELLLYFLEQKALKQTHIQYLVALDFDDMFIFPTETFETNFYKNKGLIKEFKQYKSGKLPSISTTDDFYREIASKYIASSSLTYWHIPIREYFTKYINDDSKMSELYKVFSAETLLKKTVANDSNVLNRKFYNELLYILGLEEKKDGSNLVLQRANKQRASLIEKTITVLKDNDRKIRDNSKYGETYDERIYNVALELSILWLNRILFLKLLETQLYKYNKDDKYKFLNPSKVKFFDDFNTLFFSVFGKNYKDRDNNVSLIYGHLPYLNSSLFEKCQLEWDTITMANIKDNDGLTLPIFSSSVLKNGQTKQLPLIEYLLSFLDAFDFSSDKNTITSNGDKLINASVLGLIFEKINGYKDGAIFTPAYITQYISKFTIEKCVVDKFNKKYKWNCKNLTDVHNKIEDIDEANELVNDLKILDPAVGSGHFLVSALNELIYIKYELGILVDDNGKTINRREYNISIKNDEILITDSAGVFVYDKNNTESQRVQQTIFNEKKRIIENCLFGVDINPNAVNICRLRLWIELLKNAYYNSNGELQTLPNIDINIKCGNSLVHRFDLGIDVSKVMNKSNVIDYKNNVRDYKETNDKDKKYKIEEIIKNIKDSFSEKVNSNSKDYKSYMKNKKELALSQAPVLFPLKPAELKQKAKREKELLSQIASYENKYRNKAYNNALEWRFEFPEVLDSDGNFEGFDCIIGNPPYLEEGKNKSAFDGFREDSPYYIGKMNLWYGFACYGMDLLKDGAYLTFIAKNNWTTSAGASKMRNKIVSDAKIIQTIDFNDFMVFDEASIQTMIMTFQKNNIDDNYTFDNIVFEKNCTKNDVDARLNNVFADSKPIISRNKFIDRNLVFSAFDILLDKISKNKIYLNDNEATNGIHTHHDCVTKKIHNSFPTLKVGKGIFVISHEEKKNLGLTKNEELLIKPFFTSDEIMRYWTSCDNNWWVIYTTSEYKNEKSLDNYPNIKKHLDSVNKAITSDFKPYGLHRARDNRFFVGEKITSLRKCVGRPSFSYSNFDCYVPAMYYVIKTTRWNIKFLTGVLNSKLVAFWLKHKGKMQGGNFQVDKEPLMNIPLPIFDNIDKAKVSKMISLVDDIINKKKNGQDSSSEEKNVDDLVYDIYGLTHDEIQIIESNV